MQRAYSLFEIKSIDEDARVIEGIASTPTTDRQGDIVEPEGAAFKLPIPLLWQHRSAEPIGEVVFAKPNKEGIPFRAKIANILEPGKLKDRLDEAWQSVKARLVRGTSIGFTPIEDAEIKGTYGRRFIKWEWLELSLVTIPANIDATIQTIKQFDTDESAAPGTTARVTKSKPPGASGPVRIIKPKPEGTMITEQIKQFEATRAAKAAEMSALMAKSAEKGETLDAAQAEAYDTLAGEVKSVDEHIARLRAAEATNKAAAVEVKATDTKTGSEARAPIVRVESRSEKGIGFARYAIALAAARGVRSDALEVAKQRWPDQPEVQTLIKAAVAAGTTTDATWAGPLAQPTTLVNEFLDLLRPRTLIGQLEGRMRRVPFNVNIPAITSGGTVAWVGQTVAKPLSALAFSTVSLTFAKAAGIVVLSDELVKFSRPSAEQTVRDTMVDTMRVFLDTQFIDPAVAVAANVSPASITNGVAGTAAGGTTEAFARADLRALLGLFATNQLPLDGVVLIMSESIAFTLGTMINAVGAPAFPGITVQGGNILGIPVITSNVVGAQIVAAHAPSILFADDGQTEIDVSREASVQMDGAPDNPTSATTVLVSLWQRNMTGLRFDRYMTWLKARANVVQRIHTVAYA